jgi:hypothetical protein
MPESSQDQLGEQMQIHELTRPRKVNEASVVGALGGAKAVAGGIGSALGKSLMTKAFGGVDVTSKNGPAQSREQGFKSMVNSPEAKTLATTMQAAWQQTVHNFLMNSKDAAGNPATSLKNVTQPSVDSLLPELQALVNKMIGGRYGASFNYQNMASNITDPVTKAGIQEVVSRINEYIQAIYKATVEGVDPKSLTDSWLKLVGDGVLPGQNAVAYDTNRGAINKKRLYKDPTGKDVIDLGNGPEYFDISIPAHKQYWQELSAGKAT